MSTYTPSTEQIRSNYVEGMIVFYGERGSSEYEAQFDRWLAAHDAEARARAFREAAGVARNYDTGYDTTAATIAEALADAAAWREVRAGVVAEEPEPSGGLAKAIADSGGIMPLIKPQGEPSDAQVEAARVVLRDAWHFTPDVVRAALRAAGDAR